MAIKFWFHAWFPNIDPKARSMGCGSSGHVDINAASLEEAQAFFVKRFPLVKRFTVSCPALDLVQEIDLTIG
jgi:hypothetical protein